LKLVAPPSFRPHIVTNSFPFSLSASAYFLSTLPLFRALFMFTRKRRVSAPSTLMGCDVCRVSISQGQKWSLVARTDHSKWRSALRPTWKKVGFLLEFANPHQLLLGFLHFLFFRASRTPPLVFKRKNLSLFLREKDVHY